MFRLVVLTHQQSLPWVRRTKASSFSLCEVLKKDALGYMTQLESKFF